MFSISLTNLKFFAFHGVHEEERILGNNYVVNVDLSFNSNEQITSLGQTINYATVYEVIKKRMQVPTALLETLAQELNNQIHAIDERIIAVSVTIQKRNPPIQNIEGDIHVKYKTGY